MRKPIRRTSIALALAAISVALLPASEAGANRSQVTIIQHDDDLLGAADTRNARLDEFRDLGIEIVKFRLDWRTLAPDGDSNTKPNFDAADPAQYPQDRWTKYDELVRGIVARGMRPYIMLGGRAPEWATAGSGFVDRPDPGEYKLFVQAVGTRYSGNYGGTAGTGGPLPLPGGTAGTAPLPRVTVFGDWNEVNLASWLAPQYSGSTPISPRTYRGMVYAAQDGLDASGHGGDEHLIGELQPFTGAGNSTKKVRPVAFLRELACLDRKYKPYTGSAATRRGCTGSFRKLPGTGLAIHPYTYAGGPTVRQRHPDDASIGELSRMTRALDAIANRGRIKKKMPMWISEFGFRTNPPDRFQSPIKKVPGFMGRSEWIAYRNRRVVSYSQYLIRDVPGWRSGLRFEDGTAKPGIYNAFQLPFFARTRSSSKVEVFGGVRNGAAGQQVTVEQRLGGGSFRALGTVTLGSNGYFLKTFNISRAGSRQYRFKAGGGTSRRTSAARR